MLISGDVLHWHSINKTFEQQHWHRQHWGAFLSTNVRTFGRCLQALHFANTTKRANLLLKKQQLARSVIILTTSCAPAIDTYDASRCHFYFNLELFCKPENFFLFGLSGKWLEGKRSKIEILETGPKTRNYNFRIWAVHRFSRRRVGQKNRFGFVKIVQKIREGRIFHGCGGGGLVVNTMAATKHRGHGF